MKGKKAISDVISTVILILISLVAVSMIAIVIIPFTRDNLNKNTGCFNSIGQISIIPEGSCYFPTNTTVRVKFNKINTSEIYISLQSGQNIKSFDLKQGQNYNFINNGLIIKMPDANGGEVNYIFNNTNSSTASVGPVINNVRCDVSDSINLNPC